MLDEKAFVNGIVGLHATGGSTNHTMHIVAMAAAAGIALTWNDFSDLAAVVPLLARVYPNGKADVNHFHAAGGMALVIRELLGAGLLHEDVTTVNGQGLSSYTSEPHLHADGTLVWRDGPDESGDESVLRGAAAPFSSHGGLKVLHGDLGQAIIKTSAIAEERHIIEAPARIFHSQEDLQAAYRANDLTGDFVAVVRFQGPKANGMPELHRLVPPLAVLQDRGQRVALVTDGRMSGASGKVPAAIHVTPEAAEGGPIAKLRDGDRIRVDAVAGTITVTATDDWTARPAAEADLASYHVGIGRELFTPFRDAVGPANAGATIFAF